MAPPPLTLEQTLAAILREMRNHTYYLANIAMALQKEELSDPDDTDDLPQIPAVNALALRKLSEEAKKLPTDLLDGTEPTETAARRPENLRRVDLSQPVIIQAPVDPAERGS